MHSNTPADRAGGQHGLQPIRSEDRIVVAEQSGGKKTEDNKILTDVVASVLSKTQTIILVQIMFNICKIIIEITICHLAVPHWDIDLDMKK